PAYRQAESDAAVCARVSAIQLNEGLEDVLEPVPVNADTGVTHVELHVADAIDLRIVRPHIDRAACAGELSRVRQQIRQDLCDAVLLAAVAETWSRANVHGEAALVRGRLDHGECRGDRSACIARLAQYPEAACLDAGEVEHF